MSYFPAAWIDSGYSSYVSRSRLLEVATDDFYVWVDSRSGGGLWSLSSVTSSSWRAKGLAMHGSSSCAGSPSRWRCGVGSFWGPAHRCRAAGGHVDRDMTSRPGISFWGPGLAELCQFLPFVTYRRLRTPLEELRVQSFEFHSPLRDDRQQTTPPPPGTSESSGDKLHLRFHGNFDADWEVNSSSRLGLGSARHWRLADTTVQVGLSSR